MCRFAVFATRNYGLVLSVLASLVEASRFDFIADREWGFKSHGDGWGYSVAVFKGRWFSSTYKTRSPIWYDDMGFLRSLVEGADLVLGLVHTRKASSGMPVDTFSAHPYTVQVEDGSLLHVAQNGGIDRDRAVEEFLGNEVKFDVSRVTDTFVYALLIAREYDGTSGSPPKRLLNALIRLHRRLNESSVRKSCLNTAVLLEGPGDVYVVAGVRDYYGEGDYYKLYEYALLKPWTGLETREEEETFGVKLSNSFKGLIMVSSTVAEVYEEGLKGWGRDFEKLRARPLIAPRFEEVKNNIVKVAYVKNGEIVRLYGRI